MEIRTIEWSNGGIKLIDQTRLPLEFKHVYIKDIKALWHAIKVMQVRGAPALGAAAGLGVYLGVKDSKASNYLYWLVAADSTKFILGARENAPDSFGK